MANAPRTPAARRAGGFSFVEILIVMAIIAVLSGLVVVAIQLVSRKKPEFDTETRAVKLAQAAEAVKLKWGLYPPASLLALEAAAGGGGQIKKLPNRTNEGIEALFQAIYWPGTGVDPQLGDGELCNTDDDGLEKAVGSRGKVLFEVKDAWDNPYAYFPYTEYGAAAQKPHAYVTKDGETVDVVPWKTENGFENPTTCQVFSFGPDGQPNTEDDIKGW